jgi:hypothetical protein
VDEARGILHRLERDERRASIRRERALAELVGIAAAPLDASESILLGFAETLCTEHRTRVRDRVDERCPRMKGVLSAGTLQSIDIAWEPSLYNNPYSQF